MNIRSNITQLVDRLEADGLVKRTDDPADRRAVCAEVSALGRKRHAAGAKAVNAVYQAVARELSPMDPQALKRALNAVRCFFSTQLFMYVSYSTELQFLGG